MGVLSVVFTSTFLPAAFSAEILISDVQSKQLADDHYRVGATVKNLTGERKEIVLRAQIAFYDRASPEGDVPAAVLRKDVTEYMQPGESRFLEINIINEGSPIPGAVRRDTMVRVRRQREWNY